MSDESALRPLQIPSSVRTPVPNVTSLAHKSLLGTFVEECRIYRKTEIWFKSDWAYVLLISLFGLSGGYLGGSVKNMLRIRGLMRKIPITRSTIGKFFIS